MMDTGASPVTSTIRGFAILHGSSVRLYLRIDSQISETSFDGGEFSIDIVRIGLQ